MQPKSNPTPADSTVTGSSPLPSDSPAATDVTKPPSNARRVWLWGAIFALALLANLVVVGVLVSIFERRQEATRPFVRVVAVDELTTDPTPWGRNWPFQYDSYRLPVDDERSNHGGSESLPPSKLEESPWLKRLYAGYAFSLDYREARGHAFMLTDQEQTRRVSEAKQSGACLHCHASVVPTYRRLGREAEQLPVRPEDLAGEFDWPRVIAGFELLGQMEYAQAHAELLKTPTSQCHEDGSPCVGVGHPVSCIDCHDPNTLQLRVTRPGFLQGMADLAGSDDRVPHLPSVQRWRDGSRQQPYDPNQLASRQEMRSFVCAQCHVEYYCATRETLFYPWKNGLKVEQIEQTFDEHRFPDGSPFYDYLHAETQAPLYKAQHPEFELWSQGIHARAGVSCADCHMPYERQGATKVSSHAVTSPLLNINRACQVCHRVPEAELKARVETIQDRTKTLMEQAATAMLDMLEAFEQLQTQDVSEEHWQPLFKLQRQAMWRLDFISSENSKGFHADQESARILAESIDFSRQAQAAAYRLLADQATSSPPPADSPENATTDSEPPPATQP